MAGATGYTGSALVARLAAAGLPTWAHVRPDSPRLSEWRERFESLGVEVDTTPWEAPAMTARFADLEPDLVFALLGTTRSRQVRERRQGVSVEANSYERVDYGLTVMLLEAMCASAAEARFVYLSSAGAGGGRSAYLQARQRVEQKLAESSAAWTVARPSFITGPDREEGRPMERLGAAMTDCTVALAGLFGAHRVRERYRSASADELAAALLHWARSPEGARRILESEELRGFADAGREAT